jgi:hypothetical protein
VTQLTTRAPAHMFIAALFTIVKLWKLARYPTTDKCIKKMRYLFTMEFYSAPKKEILSFTGKWMGVENIILSKVSQAQKTKNLMFSYTDYRLKTKAVTLLDMDHTLRGDCTQGG